MFFYSKDVFLDCFLSDSFQRNRSGKDKTCEIYMLAIKEQCSKPHLYTWRKTQVIDVAE